MCKLKILLLFIYTPTMFHDRDEIGIASIGAYLREHGYEVMIISATENRLDYDKIQKFEPAVVGMTVYRDSVNDVYKICGKLKIVLPDVKICLGGVLPTYYHLEIMNEAPLVDFIVRGEGELVFLNLLHHLENNLDLKEVRGITYRQGDKVIINESEGLIADLDSLPFPSRDVLRDNNVKIAVISTTRGCYGKCSFCESPTFWTDKGVQKWRGRSVENLVDEIEKIYRDLGVRFFDITNVSFEDPGCDYDSVRRFAEQITARNLCVSYQIAIRSTFYRKATSELIELLKESGLCDVFVGVESAHEPDLRLFRKMATLKDNINSIEFFRKHNVPATIGFINLHPYSTFAALRDNLAFLKKYGYAGYFCMLKSLFVDKGAELFARLKDDGLLLEGTLSKGYRYKFVDEKIGQMASLLDDYFVNDNEIGGVISFVAYCERSLITCTAYAEKQFRVDKKHSEAHQLTVDARQKFRAVFSELNERNSEWFSLLLDLAENKWERQAALDLTNRYLGRDYLRNLDAELHTIRNKLYGRLLRLSGEYEYYVI